LKNSFYWHDYETWGVVPWRDRACQFAGQRTDTELNCVGSPRILFCQPPTDVLPHPQACLVTGITPQQAIEKGVCEAHFASAIHAELAYPGTCSVGYNNIRFDDELTRFLFYRNFLDPYQHHYGDNRSRWDLIDVLRLAHALRPDGIQWPQHEPDVTSFKLEALTAANAIQHDAHDALADVQATIALARLLRTAQPRLFFYTLELRDKKRVQTMLATGQPLLHVSARYPARRGCIAPILPVAHDTTNPNAVIVFDLRDDPHVLIDLSLADLRERVFTASALLADNSERIALKKIRYNHCPMLAPLTTLTPQAAERWMIDPVQVSHHARIIQQHATVIAEKIQHLYELPPMLDQDPEHQLYKGFFSAHDRKCIAHVHRLSPQELATHRFEFDDQTRLPELLFRYRARNWPETLSSEELDRWHGWRLQRLLEPSADNDWVFEQYAHCLAQLRVDHATDPDRLALLDQLDAWTDQLLTQKTG
jgi:exodeoxyribonuclease-1